MSDRSRAIFFLVLAALFWSSGGLLIKSVNWNPMGIAGSRSLVAALTLAIFARRFHFRKSKAMWGGAIAYAATVTLFVLANKLTTAANAILLQYTAPIYVALFGMWFLKEKCSRFDAFTIVVAFGGLSLFFFDELEAGGFLGNIVAVLSGVAFAWTALFLRKQKGESRIESIFLGNLIAALVCLPGFFQGSPSQTDFFLLFILGVFQLGIPYILYSTALKHVSALEAVIIPFIEPILNPLWVLLLLGEKPGPFALLGGLAILGVVLLRGLRPLWRRRAAIKETAIRGT